MAKVKNKKINIFKILYYILVTLICLIGVFLIYYCITSQINSNNKNYRPKISMYTIVSPSMTPVIEVYDVVINTRADKPSDIQIGDIITYISSAPTSEGMTITHRVIGINKDENGNYEYLTQGDNNEQPDPLYVPYDDVIGVKAIIIPKLGKLQFLIANQKGWLFLLLIPVAIFIFKDVLKLIDLFGLRKKVDRVAGIIEESPNTKKKEAEQKRKEKIKKQLKERASIRESQIRNKKEPSGFLKKYTETTINVSTNRYQKDLPKSQKEKKLIEEDNLNPIPIFTDDIEILDETFDIPVPAKKIEEPKEVKVEKKKPVVINQSFEILDTDELTTKIKEYDNKIAELDKMIKEMENIKKDEQQEEIIEEDNFLTDKKIKVISVEETKNKKRKTEKETTKEEKTEKSEKIKVVKLKSLSNSKEEDIVDVSVHIKNKKYNKEDKILTKQSKKKNKLITIEKEKK